MDYKELQSFTREIVFRCHLATPSTEEETKLHVEGITLNIINKTAEVIGNIEDDEINKTSTESIINAVCDKFKIDEESLSLKTRKRHIVEARQIAMHLLFHNTKLTLAEIGWMLGRFNHSTVSHAIRTVKNLKATNRQYSARFREITNTITCNN